MTPEEVEIVAEELAKIGGTSWYPGRGQGSIARLVSDRYRDRAKAAIAALDRFRSSRGEPAASPSGPTEDPTIRHPSASSPQELHPGLKIIYRPPNDRRAYSSRVEKLEGSHAYIVPELRICTGWISIEQLLPRIEADLPKA